MASEGGSSVVFLMLFCAALAVIRSGTSRLHVLGSVLVAVVSFAAQKVRTKKICAFTAVGNTFRALLKSRRKLPQVPDEWNEGSPAWRFVRVAADAAAPVAAVLALYQLSAVLRTAWEDR